MSKFVFDENHERFDIEEALTINKGRWADGNLFNYDRLGLFVTAGNDSNEVSIANSKSYICGVTVTNDVFLGTDHDKPEYCVVQSLGVCNVRDDGTLQAGDKCMPANDGTAVKSSNNLGYRVLGRVNSAQVQIIISPNNDMIQRIKKDVDSTITTITTINNRLDTHLTSTEVGDIECVTYESSSIIPNDFNVYEFAFSKTYTMPPRVIPSIDFFDANRYDHFNWFIYNVTKTGFKMRLYHHSDNTDLITDARFKFIAYIIDGNNLKDSELADIRVGSDGTVYESAGEAVRKQIELLEKMMVRHDDNGFYIETSQSNGSGSNGSGSNGSGSNGSGSNTSQYDFEPLILNDEVEESEIIGSINGTDYGVENISNTRETTYSYEIL